MKRELGLIISFFFLNFNYGQDTAIDKTVFEKALKLEKGHPSEFLIAASDLSGKNKDKEAAFLFYLGQLRYRYYLAAKLKIKSSDKETYNALQMVTGSILIRT